MELKLHRQHKHTFYLKCASPHRHARGLNSEELSLAWSKQLAIISCKPGRLQGPRRTPVLSVQLNKNHHSLAKVKSFFSKPRTPSLFATGLTTWHKKEVRSTLWSGRSVRPTTGVSQIEQEAWTTTELFSFQITTVHDLVKRKKSFKRDKHQLINQSWKIQVLLL